MFSKAGTMELHTAMHERLDLLLRHVATVPDDLQQKLISGFGHPSIWKQLVHILTWVHDLQNGYEKRHELICVVSRKSNLTRPWPNVPRIGAANSGVLLLSSCT
jgi:hypothetical protein